MYIPAVIWLFSAVVCFYIARHRGVKSTAFLSVVVALLGPLAIPIVFLIKPEQQMQ